MSEEQLIVRRIKDGTVLDHIDHGKALKVLDALNIEGENDDIVTIAMNVPSKKFGKKDIIKIENKCLQAEETNRIALISPRATVNIVKDYKVVEKRDVKLPDFFVNIFKCPNPTCVSNAKEPILPILDIVKKDPPLLRCRYCRRLFSTNDLLS